MTKLMANMNLGAHDSKKFQSKLLLETGPTKQSFQWAMHSLYGDPAFPLFAD